MPRPRPWAALAILLFLTLVHVALAVRFPLAPDETYYWEWSRRLDWGYYDQAPLIAWLIRASTSLLGSTEIGVRAGVILCATITLWLVYLTALRLFGSRAGTMAMVVAGVTPMGLVGGFAATYDVPLAMFWAWAMYLMAKLTAPHLTPLPLSSERRGEPGPPPSSSQGEGTPPPSPSPRADQPTPSPFQGEGRGEVRWCAWLQLGLVVGLGMLSKYTMALALPCALLYLAGRAELRRWLRRPEPYLAALVALAVLSPNIAWQAVHGWVSFAHMVGLTGKGDPSRPIRQLGDFVGSQAALVTPLLFLGMGAALWDYGRRRGEPGGDGRWLVFCFSAPVLVLFTLLALKTKVQANWAAFAWIGASVAYAGWIGGASEGAGRDGGTSPPYPSPRRGEGSTPSPLALDAREGSTRTTPSPFQREGSTRTGPSPFQGEGSTRTAPSPFQREGSTRTTPSPFQGEGSTRTTPSPFQREGSTRTTPSPFQGEGRGEGRRSRSRLGFAWAAIVCAAAISALAGWPELRVALGIRVPARFDQSRKMYGGRELAAACAREMRTMRASASPPAPLLREERGGPIVGAVTYDNASRAAFYVPGQPRAFCFFLGTRENQYRFLNPEAGLRRGGDALIVDHRPHDDPLLAPFHTVFERVEPVPEPVVVHVSGIYGEPVVTYYLYRCYGYMP